MCSRDETKMVKCASINGGTATLFTPMCRILIMIPLAIFLVFAPQSIKAMIAKAECVPKGVFEGFLAKIYKRKY